uniref:PHD-type domain-containing protein n=1 Tax=Gongylonema pulchrum TaxID=637853 RepID=A0A183DG57_9BILA
LSNFQPDCEEDDKIIFCDGCNLSVHQSCYGLDLVPQNEWLCQKCALLGINVFPNCALCPLTGGAMKCTECGYIWAHIACALWISEVRFVDFVHREPIANICDVPLERWMLRCAYDSDAL